MGNTFAAVGTVKGKKTVVRLVVGGANLDLDGIRRHFGHHPLPVKFDGPPTFTELDVDVSMNLNELVRNPEKLKQVMSDVDGTTAVGVLAPDAPATEAEVAAAEAKGLTEPHIHVPGGGVITGGTPVEAPAPGRENTAPGADAVVATPGVAAPALAPEAEPEAQPEPDAPAGRPRKR